VAAAVLMFGRGVKREGEEEKKNIKTTTTTTT